MKLNTGEYRFLPGGMLLLYGWLVLLTLIFILFGHGAFVPVDARTDLPVHGMHLEFPAWASLVEPATAVFHMLETTPDYWQGIISMLLWLMAGVFAYTCFISRRHAVSLSSCLPRALRYAAMAALVFVVYIVCIMTSHFPGWVLKKDVPGLVAADLHSHSMMSHDGIISGRDSLLFHRERGYDLVALTDHINPRGPFVSYLEATDNTAAALPGIEMPIYYGGNFYLSAVGMDRDTPMPGGLAWMHGNAQPRPPLWFPPYLWSVQRFIDTIHRHHGIVDVVALNLHPSEVYGLAAAGVDGFEIVNSGREPLPDNVRQALLKVQHDKGVSLLACSDWHGWSGALQVWTVVNDGGGAHGMSAAGVVMNALRQHDSARVTPVVPFPIHRMGWLEMLVSPFKAVFLYARSISLAQMLSWWMWTGLLTLLMLSDKPLHDSSYGRLALRTGLGVAGMLQLADGALLWQNTSPQAPAYAFDIKVTCCCVGLGLALLIITRLLSSRAPAPLQAPILRLNVSRFPYLALVRDGV